MSSANKIINEIFFIYHLDFSDAHLLSSYLFSISTQLSNFFCLDGFFAKIHNNCFQDRHFFLDLSLTIKLTLILT